MGFIDHGRDSVHGKIELDQINPVAILLVLSMSEETSNQVRVSLAQVVVTVDHNSAKETFVTFVSEVLGFDTFVSAMIIGMRLASW